MSIANKVLKRTLPPFLKFLLPAGMYDDIFVPEFLNYVNLRMLNMRKTVRCFRLGFLPFEYLWFDLDHNDYRNYIPTRNNYQRRRINGDYNAILGNKILFENHLKSVIAGIDRLHVVESLGYVKNGFLHSFTEDIISGDIDSLIGMLKERDIIIKPVSGDGGVGFECLSFREGNLFINKQSVSFDFLKIHIKRLDNYLVQRRIIQKGLAGEIYSGSVNTMRIATMIDPVTGKPFIAYAVHRFGSAQSGFVDNGGQGGIVAKIDIDSGRLSMVHNFSKKGHMEVYEKHPVSSVMIYNQEITGWQNIKGRILEMAGRMPYLKYIGWDFALSNDDLFVLEGNVSPGLGLVQMYDPMKNFTQAWNFFRHYGYVNY